MNSLHLPRYEILCKRLTESLFQNMPDTDRNTHTIAIGTKTATTNLQMGYNLLPQMWDQVLLRGW